ncbi:hypothetical protein SAMN05421828_1562 [Acidiphilium rubrum]|uniref:Uncharacterized protein n=1 Tax=Acidiphilium rubrum TaxID=526 RepID=A0A8G2CP59_ACIRU|nr:hypothetical protein SAMN05421828_1562 [Acidiphilium rubrum]
MFSDLKNIGTCQYVAKNAEKPKDERLNELIAKKKLR